MENNTNNNSGVAEPNQVPNPVSNQEPNSAPIPEPTPTPEPVPTVEPVAAPAPEPNLYGQPNSKASSIKFALVTALVAIVVLGIAVWAIVFFVSGRNQKTNIARTGQTEAGQTETAQTEIAQTETNQSNANNQEDRSSAEIVAVTDIEDATQTTDGVSTSEPAKDIAQDGSQTTNNSATQSQAQPNIPKTGPEDILPFALIAGMFITYLGSKSLVKKAA
ncbi:hypothetical protein IJH74_00885 [Candidatus Saccharibacteria bacterium]|nr:hypothetical protein [Candidatus Saccharibacteria bacterium]